MSRAEECLASDETGDAARRLIDAALLYATASYPHLTRDSAAMAALACAQSFYIRGAKLAFPGSGRVEITHAGRRFVTFLHVPAAPGPWPLVIDSAGSDVVKEQTAPFFAPELLRRGIALLSIDLPGIGDSVTYRLTPELEQLHRAAVRWALSDPRFDRDRIAVMGTSFGGNAAARLATMPEPGVAAVVSASGPLRHIFTLPAAQYQSLPPLTMDAVRDRIGLPPDADDVTLADALTPFALPVPNPQRAHTRLLVLTTDRDPIAPLTDLRLLTDHVTRHDLIVQRQDGHCAPPAVRYPLAARWLEDVFAGSPTDRGARP